jgi:membrane protein required for colicin V production
LNLVDVLMVVVLVAGFIHGIAKGAIQEVSAAVALVVGVIVAGKVAESTTSVTSQLAHPTAARIFMFVVTFIVVAIVIGLLGKLISNLAKKANLSPIDRILGGVIGAFLVAIAAGLVFKLLAMGGMQPVWVASSGLAQRMMGLVSYLTRFLPQNPGGTTASLAWCGIGLGKRVYGSQS